MSPWKTALLAVAGLAGCVTTGPMAVPDGPPGFRQGYVDGCRSGLGDALRDGLEAQYRKDEGRYRDDDAYRRGWDEGHGACYEEELKAPRMVPGGGRP